MQDEKIFDIFYSKNIRNVFLGWTCIYDFHLGVLTFKIDASFKNGVTLTSLISSAPVKMANSSVKTSMQLDVMIFGHVISMTSGKSMVWVFMFV